MSLPAVVCVLRSGNVYGPGYAKELHRQVRRHWEGKLNFWCLTDTPVGKRGIKEIPLKYDWPGYWSKLEMFRPDLKGPMLTFDLDTMIVGSLSDIRAVTAHTMLRAFKPGWEHRVASGMMYLPEEVRGVIWERWMLDPEKWMRVHRWPNKSGHLPGDQGFLQETWERSAWGGGRMPDKDWRMFGIRRWQKSLPGQVVSYKRHVRKRGKVPPRARVVCFHGKPRPHVLGWKLP